MTKTYKIDVDCANCAAKMEEAAKKTAGVKNANVNFMLLKMTVDFEDGADEKKVMKDVLKNCKKVEDDCEIEF
ncbi:MAG: cation transporter [Treponemataceae bacterium]|nr:cation transporter [Treponemataceae bacterium]